MLLPEVPARSREGRLCTSRRLSESLIWFMACYTVWCVVRPYSFPTTRVWKGEPNAGLAIHAVPPSPASLANQHGLNPSDPCLRTTFPRALWFSEDEAPEDFDPCNTHSLAYFLYGMMFLTPVYLRWSGFLRQSTYPWALTLFLCSVPVLWTLVLILVPPPPHFGVSMEWEMGYRCVPQ